jgi:hypothetical protein
MNRCNNADHAGFYEKKWLVVASFDADSGFVLKTVNIKLYCIDDYFLVFSTGKQEYFKLQPKKKL